MNVNPYSETTPQQARRAVAAASATLAPGEPVGDVFERRVAYAFLPGSAREIRVRVYTPSGDGPRSVLMYFHGGGWVICDLDTHDALARRLHRADHRSAVGRRRGALP